MKKIRSKLSFANVVSCLALFVALAGGTAYAMEALPKESVGTEQLKGYAVTGAKIANSTINSAKLSPNSVTETTIAKGAVATNKLPTGAVVNSKIAAGAVDSSKLSAGVKEELRGPRGEPGAPGAPGGAKAWATIGHAGDVKTSSGNVTATEIGVGFYCVAAGVYTDLNSVAAVTSDFSDSSTNYGDKVQVANGTAFNECPAGQWEVFGLNAASELRSTGFTFIVG